MHHMTANFLNQHVFVVVILRVFFSDNSVILGHLSSVAAVVFSLFVSSSLAHFLAHFRLSSPFLASNSFLVVSSVWLIISSASSF